MRTKQERAKMRTYAEILSVFDEKDSLRWKELHEKTSISSRTLSDRLKDLNNLGYIRRVVNNSVYPPAVSYEISSRGKIATSGPLTQAVFISNYMRELRDNRLKYATILESEDINKYIRTTAADFYQEFLFTLTYGLEDSQLAPLLVEQYARSFSAILEHTIESLKDKTHVIEALKNSYTELMNQRKKGQDEILSKYSEDFNDPQLAKAIFKLYSVNLALGFKGDIHSFLEKLKSNLKMKKEIEEILEFEIDEERLISIINEDKWKSIKISKMP